MQTCLWAFKNVIKHKKYRHLTMTTVDLERCTTNYSGNKVAVGWRGPLTTG